MVYQAADRTSVTVITCAYCTRMIARRSAVEAVTFAVSATRRRRSFRWSNCLRSFGDDASSSSSSNKSSSHEAVKSMRSRFQESNDNNNGEIWDSLWKEQKTPWDLGGPTPVLAEELDTYYRNRLSSKPTTTNKKQRALVPGCGAGYDLLQLASFYDSLIDAKLIEYACVVGLDISETSLQVAAQVLEAATCTSKPQTTISLLKGDYFDKSSWESVASFGGATDGSCNNDPLERPFDLIFDYTFMCALPPSARLQWGETTAELMNPEAGCLLTLMFPLVHDDPTNEPKELQGPPYAVTFDDYRQALEPHGLLPEPSCPRQSSFTVKRRMGQEMVC